MSDTLAYHFHFISIHDNTIMSFALGILFAFGSTIAWGINSHIMKKGARNEHPYMAMVYRALVSFPLLLTLTLLLHNLEVITIYFESNNFYLVLLMVLSIVVGDSFFIYAMKKYEVSTILPIAALYPLWTSTILIVTGIEILTSLIVIGTVVAVSGVFIVTRFRVDEQTQQQGIGIEPILLGMGVAFGWGSSVVFARLLLNISGTESFGLMTVRTFFIGLVALALYFRSSNNRQELKIKTKIEKMDSLKIFGVSGIFGWVLGASFLFLSLENIKAGIATPISAANPVVAVIIGQKTGIDRINYKQFLGIVLTIIGVIFIVI